jgi:hypothetical protein
MESLTGAPMGMMKAKENPVTAVALPLVCTLPIFTDGRGERRGQVIETRLAQPLGAVSRDGHPLPRLAPGLVPKSRPRGSDDDIAILGMRWTD